MDIPYLHHIINFKDPLFFLNHHTTLKYSICAQTFLKCLPISKILNKDDFGMVTPQSQDRRPKHINQSIYPCDKDLFIYFYFFDLFFNVLDRL